MNRTLTTTETLAQAVLPRRGWLAYPLVADTLLVVLGSLFVALSAQIRISLMPFSPVPITGQTLGVLLVGGLLGPRLGLAALLLYLLEGAIGLPFFAGGAAGYTHLFGATGGYLISFPIAAALTGWLAARGWDRRFPTAIAAMVLASLVIYLIGATWLAFFIGAQNAIVKGVLPFLLGDAIKILLAAAALPGGWQALKWFRGQG
ncbi:biotin transporter BioY [Chloroflexus sp.]|uniref:biotin transporter BioY n=1 Tax=Chloroflexus sp. TaxID=1904827 RepID=UPI00298EFD09|nr:biotin transporter BioY [Chloroflexus sp.]MCS6888331.1 biotin transporter BioY [Chloroflexus sp.]MDW8404575.1 biotin transporter BioY [Chloroflexus sp.]